jgi:hypothetical protein
VLQLVTVLPEVLLVRYSKVNIQLLIRKFLILVPFVHSFHLYNPNQVMKLVLLPD